MPNSNLVYLNGLYLPLEQAHISVMDRGFLFADAVYEVIPVYQGKLFRAQAHLERFKRSLKAFHFTYDLHIPEWLDIFHTLIKAYPIGDYKLYCQISRGAEMERMHRIPSDVPPTRFARLSAFQKVSLSRLREGYTAITVKDIRWDYCFIKSVALMGNVLQYQLALDQGKDEALFIKNGVITEATASNAFIVLNDKLITHPANEAILGGITRDLILDLARKAGMIVEERPILEKELFLASELWISSSTYELRPIIECNGQKIGNGKAGPYWAILIQAYQIAIEGDHETD